MIIMSITLIIPILQCYIKFLPDGTCQEQVSTPDASIRSIHDNADLCYKCH